MLKLDINQFIKLLYFPVFHLKPKSSFICSRWLFKRLWQKVKLLKTNNALTRCKQVVNVDLCNFNSSYNSFLLSHQILASTFSTLFVIKILIAHRTFAHVFYPEVYLHAQYKQDLLLASQVIRNKNSGVKWSMVIIWLIQNILKEYVISQNCGEVHLYEIFIKKKSCL